MGKLRPRKGRRLPSSYRTVLEQPGLFDNRVFRTRGSTMLLFSLAFANNQPHPSSVSANALGPSGRAGQPSQDAALLQLQLVVLRLRPPSVQPRSAFPRRGPSTAADFQLCMEPLCSPRAAWLLTTGPAGAAVAAACSAPLTCWRICGLTSPEPAAFPPAFSAY